MSELRLKQKAKQIREKKVLNRDEVYHGALEDILLGKWGVKLTLLWVHITTILMCKVYRKSVCP